MDIIVTRYIGIRGTALLARSFREELLKTLPGRIVEEAAAFDEGLPKLPEASSSGEGLSKIPEVSSSDEGLPEAFRNDRNDLPRTGEEPSDIRIAREHGASYAREYLKGGIFEALFRMSRELKCGLEAGITKIPVKQETVEVCEVLKANPYALYSGHSSLILCEHGDEMIRCLNEKGIPAFFIGTTNPSNDKILINGDERGYLPHIRTDELERLMSGNIGNTTLKS
ncbi:MAG: hypothetical protein K6F53_00675 [Lachnospiraceae bacterium]|nr:hypothetical protein [Lachnospiraceae bacterium]